MALITARDLAGFRRDAEGQMVDACVITAPGSNPVFDEDTGLYTTTPGSVLYEGKCKRQSPPGVRAEIEVDSGDHKVTLSRAQLHIPALAVGPDGDLAVIPVGSLVLMTACPFEPTSVGRRFRVDGPGGKSLGTAQRLNVTEVLG